MAIYYVSPSATVNTSGNDGSWANPYHIFDVFRGAGAGVIGPVSYPADQNSLAVGDAVGIIEGTYNLAVGQNLLTTQLNGTVASPVMAYAQDATTEARLAANRASINGANLSGNLWAHDYWYWRLAFAGQPSTWFGAQIRRADSRKRGEGGEFDSQRGAPGNKG